MSTRSFILFAAFVLLVGIFTGAFQGFRLTSAIRAARAARAAHVASVESCKSLEQATVRNVGYDTPDCYDGADPFYRDLAASTLAF